MDVPVIRVGTTGAESRRDSRDTAGQLVAEARSTVAETSKAAGS